MDESEGSLAFLDLGALTLEVPSMAEIREAAARE